MAVAPLLVEAVEAGSAVVGDAVCRIAVETQPEDLEVEADVAQVRRALVNFVINAAQAAGPQGLDPARGETNGRRASPPDPTEPLVEPPLAGGERAERRLVTLVAGLLDVEIHDAESDAPYVTYRVGKESRRTTRIEGRVEEKTRRRLEKSGLNTLLEAAKE